MELYIEKERPQRHYQRGTFLKGHTPHNKGKKITDYMDSRTAKRIVRIGNKNLRGRTDIGGWNKKAVVAIKDDEVKYVFESATKAAEVLQLERRNITAVVNKKRKHCGGYKFYFENDNEWIKYA